jgi:hypothetical protein
MQPDQMEAIQHRSDRFMARLSGVQEGSTALAAQLSAVDVPELLGIVKELTRHLKEIDNVIGISLDDSEQDAREKMGAAWLPSKAARLRQAESLRRQVTEGRQWRQLVSDLDRCPHGRHEGDTCAGWRGPGLYDGGCQGGRSLGNPLLGAGATIGVDYATRMIEIPEDKADRSDPSKWIHRARPGEMLHHHLPGYVGDDADLWQDPPPRPPRAGDHDAVRT